MQKDRLVFGLTAVFGATTALVVLMALALAEPVLFVVGAPLAAATVVFWYQSSGRLRRRVRRSRSRGRTAGDADDRRSRGGFGAGPREGFEGERGRRARRRRERRGRNRGGPGSGRESRAEAMSRAEAYRRLGLDETADEGDVQRAYRERVKEVHPDRGGDESEFRAVTEAYETLTE